MPTQQDSATERQRPITVVVVDDEQMIRAALAQTLAGGGFDLVGEAANAQDALRLVVDVRPDVVLMDSGSQQSKPCRRSSSSLCSPPHRAF